ncbi:MAG TPA: RsmB/NOP family class I SAM-dependent RNA methyltransferase, partial [Usitatibacter sp.]|nr:RsmB/NOP family class I SAM-dependent RNA methyltransferase [Usitatibacter sp.]
WLAGAMQESLGHDEFCRLAGGLLEPAPLDLRVNTLKARREEVQAALAEAGIGSEATPWSPWGLRVQGKPALVRLAAFERGEFEVQDEGSQLLALLVDPKRGEMVVDFCAGAGGKTLQMGAAMNSTGRLYAFDVSDKRLANLAPRLKRSGLSNVFPQRIAGENDPKVKRLRGKIDRVLVDAPCTGLGTLRRNPDLKVRQTAEGLAELNAKQRAILAAAAALVKPGGRLVYGTCSLLAEENEDIVKEFLGANPEFRLVPAKEVLEKQGVKVPGTTDYLHLYPHVHDTDGFFAAVLERSAPKA